MVVSDWQGLGGRVSYSVLSSVLVAGLDCASANIKLFQVFLCYLQKNIGGFVKC